MGQRIVLVTSDIFVRRLVPALAPFAPARFDYRIVDIHRRTGELARRVIALKFHGFITESLPRFTEAMVGLGLPTVIADTDILFPGAVSIDVDDEAVGRTAAEYFLAAGYRPFACVHNRMPYSCQRLEGFQAALGREKPSLFVQPERRPRDYMESWNEPTHALRVWLRDLPGSKQPDKRSRHPRKSPTKK